MAQKHSATIGKPPLAPVQSKDDTPTLDKTDAAQLQNLFVSMALEMSWQLAVVVIVPIVGGYLLDERLHTSPWCTIVGAAIAAAGTMVVLRRVVSLSNQRVQKTTSKKGGA